MKKLTRKQKEWVRVRANIIAKDMKESKAEKAIHSVGYGMWLDGRIYGMLRTLKSVVWYWKAGLL